MDITIKNLQTKVPIRVPRINRAARQALLHFRIKDAMIVIVFVTPGRMKALNAKYLKHHYVTDVLTFDYSGIRDQGSGIGKKTHAPAVMCGEIVICPTVAAENAKEFKTTVQRELELYTIHGLLHLMGYDDHSPKEIFRMREKEEEVFKLLYS